VAVSVIGWEGIEERLARVRARVQEASARARGKPVLLLAVSKGQPAEALRAAYAVGQRDFGENYVQELVKKAEALADLSDLRFHLIGHLQRNKVRQVLPHVAAVHSVDSVELAREIGKRVERELPETRRVFGDDARLPVLVEVSIAGEQQKSGCAPGELEAVLEAVESFATLRLVGLMCVPPFVDDPALSRPHFDALAALRERHGGIARLPELSMGMTADFEHAVAAGSTIVRVGTAIFGSRPARAPAGG
jgi:pyridoxal phosphate enzyme (YggS family)